MTYRRQPPWAIHPGRPSDIMDQDGVIFCTVATGCAEEKKLIAASPRLLEVLKAIAEETDRTCYENESAFGLRHTARKALTELGFEFNTDA